MLPSKKKCDEVMIALYQFCYESVGFVESLANAFGRTIEAGSLAGNVKEKCSGERIFTVRAKSDYRIMINKNSDSSEF